jgi:Mg-chelatase subunit ChlD
MVLEASDRRRGGRKAQAPGSVAGGFTNEKGTIVAADVDLVEPDPGVRERARQISARLAIPRPSIDRDPRRGPGLLTSIRYRDGADEIDLERTVEVLAEKPVMEDEDFFVRDRVRTRRSIVLAVDVSGSMKGERVRTAAATVGALASELSNDDLGVIAFWSDAAVLLELGRPVRPMEILDALLRLPARGLTNVGFPLELAIEQLSRGRNRERRVVLLSDCVHNAGADPRLAAARIPRLDVLVDVSGEKDVDLARQLAAAGHGTTHLIRTHRDVAPALASIFHN